ncbi:nucleic acid-binding, OB-fold protein [Artemisia annua]|uniref:Nucleic acid-binding, OB-fold protein n=1 Tax=Artemisia annua TaxID=35608 RepID=A0A2U1NT18_ARTAN|nr:nucleic acid-binding, OB-fold protein [Artemisia annua]
MADKTDVEATKGIPKDSETGSQTTTQTAQQPHTSTYTAHSVIDSVSATDTRTQMQSPEATLAMDTGVEQADQPTQTGPSVSKPQNAELLKSQQQELAAKVKGKAPMVEEEPNTADITDIKPSEYEKPIEVKVYRKWTSRNVPDPNPTGLCFILLDKKVSLQQIYAISDEKKVFASNNNLAFMQGNAIQANVDVRYMRQFDTTLQLSSCYRISRFGCKNTETWQRTLANDTTLLFGRYTSVVPIQDTGFPNHYFRFATYNELATRIEARDSILTDYIGIIRNMTRTREFGEATRNRVQRKNIEIQNLNGNSVTLSLWNEMTSRFELKLTFEHQQLIIIAISSCIVKRYGGTIQLSATPASSYYLNPDIPEAHQIRTVYNEMIGVVAPIPMIAPAQQHIEEGPADNTINIIALLQMNPDNITQYQRFRLEALIINVDENTEWYMNSCRTCNKKVHYKHPHWHCQEPGVPMVPNYSYSFKTIIEDHTGNEPLTWFSPEAHSLLPACSELLSYAETDPYNIPPIIRDLNNTRHTFEVYFGAESRIGAPRLILDDISDAQVVEPTPALAPQQLQSHDTEATELPVTTLTPQVQGQESEATELPAATLTPPLASTEPEERQAPPQQPGASGVRRQLFEGTSAGNDEPPTKKQKTDEHEEPK